MSSSEPPKADEKAPLRSIEQVLPEIAKLLPRLASDFDGEVIATVKALKRKLATGGLDLNDLGSLLLAIPKALAAMSSTQLPPPKPPEPPKPADFEWDDVDTNGRNRAPNSTAPQKPYYQAPPRQPYTPPPRPRLSVAHADLAREVLKMGLMKPKEKTFLNDILARDVALTPSQETWLKEIHFRISAFTSKLF